MSKRIIISISSDIGLALSRAWLARGHEVWGTYRTHSAGLDEIERLGAKTVPCDLAVGASIDSACSMLTERAAGWNVLVQGAGRQDPVGLFQDTAFNEWEESVTVNFTAQMRVTRNLLPSRGSDPFVLFFAGGGTNNATANYSAYTISKIALIKMCELLDAEVPDTRFAILGPGWVRTKIHESTLRAGARAGSNLQRTKEKLAGDELVPMSRVVECCDWMIAAPRDVVSGRNISLVYDDWGSPELDQLLKSDPNMYKLRRLGNDRLVRSRPIVVGST